MTYDRSFKKDERYDDYNAKGVFSNVLFKCDNPELELLTGFELLCKLEENELNAALESNKAHREKLEKELSETQGWINDKILKLQNIKSLQKQPA